MNASHLDTEKTIFATFLLTGFREEELCFLMWADVDLRDPLNATLRVSGEGKTGFSPKDYEERILPIPQKIAELLAGVTHRGAWVFSTKMGNRQGKTITSGPRKVGGFELTTSGRF